MQKVQDIMLAVVQGRVQGGAGRCREVQGGAGRCRGGAGRCRGLHHGKHNIRCREVQGVQAHLSFLFQNKSTLRGLVEELYNCND